MGDLSTHFDSSEFKDHVTGEVKVAPSLVANLEQLRLIIGKPIRIVSGFRSASTNAAVGGAKNSQHLFGRAADLEVGTATLEEATDAGFTGIGYKFKGGVAWAVHVDVRLLRPVTFLE